MCDIDAILRMLCSFCANLYKNSDFKQLKERDDMGEEMFQNHNYSEIIAARSLKFDNKVIAYPTCLVTTFYMCETEEKTFHNLILLLFM